VQIGCLPILATAQVDGLRRDAGNAAFGDEHPDDVRV
jgi:hypothetical protein